MEYDVVIPAADHASVSHEISGIVHHAVNFTHDRCVRVIVARSKVRFTFAS